MKKLTAFLFLLVALFATNAYARPLTLNEILEATCRIRVTLASGSGTAVFIDDNYVYVLTNAHVVGNNKNASVEFFPKGKQTTAFSGKVVWKAYQNRTDVDFAVIAIDKRQFGDKLPRIIPLLPQRHQLKGSEYIASAGCPRAEWAKAFEGHFTGLEGSRILFIPPPNPGQSGSGIHVNVKHENGKTYTYVGAVLTWQIAKKGGAIPVSTLHQLLRSRQGYKPQPIPISYRYVADYKYALGEDGIYYGINKDAYGRESVTLPPHKKGLRFLSWGIPCPPGGS
jgi:hypothetical protein